MGNIRQLEGEVDKWIVLDVHSTSETGEDCLDFCEESYLNENEQY